MIVMYMVLCVYMCYSDCDVHDAVCVSTCYSDCDVHDALCVYVLQ